MNQTIRWAFVAALLAAACSRSVEGASSGGAVATAPTGEVNVYSGRHYDSDLVLFERFTRETGIKVNLIEAQADALIERLSREAEASPADLFIAADAGVLWRAQQRGLLRPLADQESLARAPSQFRHPEGYWIGISTRARVIIYDKRAGLPAGVDGYEDLADPALKGTLCVRSSSNVYNQSLLAGLIAHQGLEAAEAWAEGVVANFARKPQGNDTDQIEAVAAGVCRMAVVNSYYLARYVGAEDERARAVGENVGLLFPSESTTGVHVNISGAGVARHAPNAANAERLIAFLLTDESQRAFAEGNNEYPVVAGLDPSGPVAAFGPFKADALPVAKLGEHQAEAIRIFDRVGWQ